MGPLEVLSSSLYAVCIYAFAWDLHTYRDVSTSHSFTMHVANRPNADYGSSDYRAIRHVMFTFVNVYKTFHPSPVIAYSWKTITEKLVESQKKKKLEKVVTGKKWSFRCLRI